MPVILQERHGNTLHITFNDPQRRNPISPDMREELIEILRAAHSNSQVRSILFSGADGTFSTGGDLKSMPPESPAATDERMDRVAVMVRLVSGSVTPTLAAVEGAAAGVSTGIAAACDYVVMGHEARFLFPFTRLGLIPDGGILVLLGHRVGHARAKRILLMGDSVEAGEAHAIGLADVVTPSSQTLEHALEAAAKLASRAPLAVAAVKHALSAGPLDMEGALAAERAGQRELYFSQDFAEGRSAFFERRAPDFTGH